MRNGYSFKEGIYNQTCFHAQQCVEKGLKGLVIYFAKKMPPKIHVVADLLNLLPSDWFADIKLASLKKIDDYYVSTRYPDALPGTLPGGLPGRTEAEEAVELAGFQ